MSMPEVLCILFIVLAFCFYVSFDKDEYVYKYELLDLYFSKTGYYDYRFYGEQHNWFPGTDDSWSQHTLWEEHYQYLAKTERTIHKKNAHMLGGGAEQLLDELIRLGKVPILPNWSSCRILEAGCGLSTAAHCLKEWGFEVTAIDFSSTVIDLAKKKSYTHTELSSTLFFLTPSGPEEYWTSLPPKKQHSIFEHYTCPHGSLQFVSGDWMTYNFEDTFDIIHCHNSLRLATKQNWIASLHRFMELLTPGGVVIVTSSNAFILDSVIEEALECGYVVLIMNVKNTFELREGHARRLLLGGVGYSLIISEHIEYDERRDLKYFLPYVR